MAYFRTRYSKKTGAQLSHSLIVTAKDKRIQKDRRAIYLTVPAWRQFERLQYRRANWRIGIVPDPEDLRHCVSDLEAHLVLYRARYHNNLKVKYDRAALQYWFQSDCGFAISNGAGNLGLDQAAIANTLKDLAYYRRLACAYQIDLF